MKVIFGKKRLDLGTLQADTDFQGLKESVVAIGAGLPERAMAFAFKDWKAMLQFSKRSEFAETIADMDERRRKLSKRSGENLTAIIARRQLVTKRIEADMRELSKRTGLPWGSRELFLRATANADPLEGEIFDPAILWTGAGFTGASLPVFYPGIPDLSWFPGKNNTTSAVQVAGIVALFNLTWFRGASLMVFGLPFFQIPNLATVGFNNVTSSVLID